MLAIHQGQRDHRYRRSCRDRAIDMREQITPARGLPLQVFEIGLREGNKHEILLARKVPRRGFPHLMSSGKMNEAILMVHGGPSELAVTQGILPGVTRKNFVEESHEGET